MVIAGCMRDAGRNLVKYQEHFNDDDTQNVKVIDLEQYTIHRSCGASADCSPAEVSINGENYSYILDVCCCKGDQCTVPTAYRRSTQNEYSGDLVLNILANITLNETKPAANEELPFHDVTQLYILAFCYATSLTAITINFFLTLHAECSRRVIMKNQ